MQENGCRGSRSMSARDQLRETMNGSWPAQGVPARVSTSHRRPTSLLWVLWRPVGSGKFPARLGPDSLQVRYQLADAGIHFVHGGAVRRDETKVLGIGMLPRHLHIDVGDWGAAKFLRVDVLKE